MKNLVIAFAALLLLNTSVFAENLVRFDLPDYPPFTYEKDGKPVGKGVDVVEKILKRAGIKYELAVRGPYARVFANLAAGSCDGVFLASKNADRDAMGVFASTVTFSRWSWFTLAGSKLDPKSPSFKQDAKVGTLLNTNQEKYLKEKGYAIVGAPTEIDSLLKMLKAGRVNVVFLSEDVFLESLAKLNEKESNFSKYVEKESPFSIYMSKGFLQNNPGFMDKLNKAIVEEVGKGL